MYIHRCACVHCIGMCACMQDTLASQYQIIASPTDICTLNLIHTMNNYVHVFI